MGERFVFEIRVDSGIEVGPPEVLYDDSQGRYTSYDVAPDGRFVLVIGDDRRPRRLNVVLNWTEELKRNAVAKSFP